MRLKTRKAPVRLPISRTGGPMKDRKRYTRKLKHKKREEE